MSQTTLSSLPPEIIQYITDRLNPLALAQCSRACHTWHSIFESSLWRSVDLTKKNYSNPASVAEALHRNVRHLRQLKTSDTKLVRYLALHHPPLSHLQSLSVKLNGEVFSLSASIVPGPGAALEITHALTTVLAGCTNLQELEIGGCSCFVQAEDGTDIFQEMMASCPTTSLKRLRIGFDVDDSVRDYIQRSLSEDRKQREKKFRRVVGQQRDLLPFLALRELVFEKPGPHIHPYRLAFLARCPNLRRIELDTPDDCLVEYLPGVLQEFCPHLDELFWDSIYDYYTDEQTAAILKSSRKGWRVLNLSCRQDYGSLFFDTLSKSAATLEEVFVVRWGDEFDIQRDWFLNLVCSAKNLRRLSGQEDGERHAHDTGVEVHAYNAFMEHIRDSGKDRTWALGAKMKYLQMQVVGVPRPDVMYRDDGTPLKHWMVEASLDGGRRYDVQRWIYEQLGRMAGLEDLILGVVNISRDGLEIFTTDEEFAALETTSITELEDALEDEGQLFNLINYQCLEFSLESGLELLAGMKELRLLDVKSTAHKIGVAELEWMHVNWPKLKEIKGLVNARKWTGQDEEGAKVKEDVEAWLTAHPHGIGSYFLFS